MEMRRSALLLLTCSLVGLSCSVLLDANGLRNGQETDASDEGILTDVGGGPSAETGSPSPDAASDAVVTITDGSTFTCEGRDAFFCDNFDGVFTATPYTNFGNGSPASSVSVEDTTSVSAPNALVLVSGGGAADEFRARQRTIVVPEDTKELYFSGDIRPEFGLAAGDTAQLLSLTFESVNGLARHQLSVRIDGIDLTLSVVDQKTFDAGPFASVTTKHGQIVPNKWTHLTLRVNVDSGLVVLEVDGKAYSTTVSFATKRAQGFSFRSAIFNPTQPVTTKRTRFDNVVLYVTR